MANIIKITHNGSEVLPTANATHYSAQMSADYSAGHVYVEFFSDAAGTVRVTPTAGIAVVEGSPFGNAYMRAGNVTHINANDAGTAPDYEPPVFEGCMTMCRVTFAGVTGAAYARVTVWRA